MIIQSITYTFADENVDEVLRIFAELQALSRLEEGMITFDVAQSVDKRNVFVLWEEYRDQAAVDAHFASEHFKRLALGGVRKLAKERLAVTAAPIA
jgi:quinol monooxygenase YgiN